MRTFSVQADGNGKIVCLVVHGQPFEPRSADMLEHVHHLRRAELLTSGRYREPLRWRLVLYPRVAVVANNATLLRALVEDVRRALDCDDVCLLRRATRNVGGEANGTGDWLQWGD